MKIINGFNGKETEIKVSSQGNGSIELWIKQSGISERETLSYLSADELLKLFQEIQRAGRGLFE